MKTTCRVGELTLAESLSTKGHSVIKFSVLVGGNATKPSTVTLSFREGIKKKKKEEASQKGPEVRSEEIKILQLSMQAT